MADTSANRREQIIRISSRLFKEKGYLASTMRDIANVLDMEAASLYHHIKSKEEILEIICFDMATRFENAIKEVNDIYFNAEERLRMAIRFHIQILTDDIDRSAVFLNEWRSLPEPKLSEFKKLRNHYEMEFRKIIEDGKTEDIFDDVDGKFATLTIMSTLNWINQWYHAEGGMTPVQIASKLSDFILGGLRKKYVTDLNYKP